MPCSCCQITDRTFSQKDAQGDLRSYRLHGAPAQTREILRAVRSLGLTDASLLDIGGGVGVIHHELVGDVVRNATHVDASAAYLDAARSEATRRGHAGQLTFIHADFVDVAGELPQADIVTLDRVVCCYPNFRLLLTAAAGRARRAMGLAYPRAVWYVRPVIRGINFLQGLRRDPFRVFLHPVEEMDAVLRRAGLRRVSTKRLVVWEVAVYSRPPGFGREPSIV